MMTFVCILLAFMTFVGGIAVGRGYSSGCLTESIKHIRNVVKYLKIVRCDDDYILTETEKIQLQELKNYAEYIVKW